MTTLDLNEQKNMSHKEDAYWRRLLASGLISKQQIPVRRGASCTSSYTPICSSKSVSDVILQERR